MNHVMNLFDSWLQFINFLTISTKRQNRFSGLKFAKLGLLLMFAWPRTMNISLSNSSLHVLFFKCNGSHLAKSIHFPNKGMYSCLLCRVLPMYWVMASREYFPFFYINSSFFFSTLLTSDSRFLKSKALSSHMLNLLSRLL